MTDAMAMVDWVSPSQLLLALYKNCTILAAQQQTTLHCLLLCKQCSKLTMLKLLHYNLTSKIGECMTGALTNEALIELLSLERRVDSDGSVHYYNAQGQLHREYGPAIEHTDGSWEWWQNGKPHRVDGPAIMRADGSKLWYSHGERHRLDGPAIDYTNGIQVWYQNGQLHRLDGPAVERPDCDRAWYIKGRELTEAEWHQQAASMATA